MSPRVLNRRSFLGSAALAGAAATILPRRALGMGRRAPSDTLNIACIGVGGMGEQDVRGVRSENVYALCDVDDHQAANSFRRFPEAKRYKDFREMLERDGANIDAVTVSTPDHTHAVASLMALRMGKPVFCQKPLARLMGEVRASGRRPAPPGWPPRWATRGTPGTGRAASGVVRGRGHRNGSGDPLLDEPPHLAPGHPAPPGDVPRSRPPGLGPLAGAGAPPPLPPGLRPLPVAGMVGLRDGGPGGHGLPRHGRRLLGPGPGVPGTGHPRVLAPLRGDGPRLLPGGLRLPRPRGASAGEGGLAGRKLRPAPPWRNRDWTSSGPWAVWEASSGSATTGPPGRPLRQRPPAHGQGPGPGAPGEPAGGALPPLPGGLRGVDRGLQGRPSPNSTFDGHAGSLTEMVLLGCLAVRAGRTLQVDPVLGAGHERGAPGGVDRAHLPGGWRP
jgi:hypothetical protein